MLQGVSFFGLLVLSFVVVEFVKMDAWMARLGEAHQAFLNDDEDDEANMGMAECSQIRSQKKHQFFVDFP